MIPSRLSASRIIHILHSSEYSNESFATTVERIGSARWLAEQAGAEVTLLELASLDIPLYNADLEALGTPPDVIRLKEILFEHPGWIICSPEYNGSYTALLKNTLDWASSPVKADPKDRKSVV